jgi:hypothetical protein
MRGAVPGLLGLAGCGAKPAPTPSTAANPNVPHERLSRIVDRYWEEHAAAGDFLSAQFLADSLALKRRFLAEVLGIPRDSLDADSRLTYDIFTRQLELDIEGLTYPSELLPIDPFDGPPLRFARAAADAGGHPFTNAKDYDNWLLRIDDNAHWAREAIANLREGMRRGYTAPRVLVERMLPLLQGSAKTAPANVFYSPLRTLPAAVAEPGRTRLRGALEHAVKENLLPAYRELHDFIQSDYLPRARPSLALSALPLGTPWYAARVKRATDGSLRRTRFTPSARRRSTACGRGCNPCQRPCRPRGPTCRRWGQTHWPSGRERRPWPPGTCWPRTRSSRCKLSPLCRRCLPLRAGRLRIPPPEFRGRRSACAPLSRAPLPAAAQPPFCMWMAPHPRPPPWTLRAFCGRRLPGRHLQSAIQQERADLPKFRRFGADRCLRRRLGALRSVARRGIGPVPRR